MVRLFFIALFSILVTACTSSGPGGPGACDASATCACSNAACACQGNGRCEATCSDNCLVACSSSQGCTGSCGAGCSASCSGPGHCVFNVGAGSNVSCAADQSCEVTCYGACRVTSSGRATATTVNCLSLTRNDCGTGVITCGPCA